ncbi:MAG: PfkB family carbohydrate kinase [Methylotetracoccus sp.]
MMDVLCVGHASYDLIFSVPRQPDADDKLLADGFLGCGGGPAANAAVTVARLGLRASFAGYLGDDLFGERHLAELEAHGITTELVVRGTNPTPLSVILVKPDGSRSLVNYKGQTAPLPADAFASVAPAARVVLFDGHEPLVSVDLLDSARRAAIPTVLDAGSLHAGTEALMGKVEHLVCSEKFARQWLGHDDPAAAVDRLAGLAPVVVVTLGDRGLLWRRGTEHGALGACPVVAVDTTGAGDVFHGAYAAGLALGLSWDRLLAYASAAGALCCTRLGARSGIPSADEVATLLGA